MTYALDGLDGDPRKRLQFLFRQYGKSKRNFMLDDVATVALRMAGEDIEGYTSLPWAPVDPEELHDYLEAVEARLPENMEYDFVLPWIAKELNALVKDAQRTAKAEGQPVSVENFDYRLYREILDRLLTVTVDTGLEELTLPEAIGFYVTEVEPQDINDLALDWAVEAIPDLDDKLVVTVPGEVVYEFDDGWTFQALTTEEQIEWEGAEPQMHHCVADPAQPHRARILEGETVAYSLRDPRGQPHLTIEIGTDGRFYGVEDKGGTRTERLDEFWSPEFGSKLAYYESAAEFLHTRDDLKENLTLWTTDEYIAPVRREIGGMLMRQGVEATARELRAHALEDDIRLPDDLEDDLEALLEETREEREWDPEEYIGPAYQDVLRQIQERGVDDVEADMLADVEANGAWMDPRKLHAELVDMQERAEIEREEEERLLAEEAAEEAEDVDW